MIYPRTPTQTHDIARHYDELDRFYREIWGEHIHHGLWDPGDAATPSDAVLRLVDLVAQHARLQPGGRVCDVGCGYGAPARYLAEHYGVSVVGLTLSEAQHRYASAHHSDGENLRFLRQDWLDNDLPDAAFDAVIAIESLAHMTDKARFFTEARRVLKPDGRLVVCTWLAADAPQPWQVRHLLEPICREGRLPSLGTAGEYHHLIAAAGLQPIYFEDLSRRVRQTWWIAARETARRLFTDAAYRRFLLDARQANRIFALTLLRMLAAYYTGAFRFGLFVAEKPPP